MEQLYKTVNESFIKMEGNKYPDIHRKISKLIKKLNLENLIKKTNAYICGGSILTLFYENRVISNIDIFFKNLEGLEKFKNTISIFDDCVFVEETDSIVHFKYKTKHLKLFKKVLGSAEEILNSFDFTICQVCFYPKENAFIMNKDFLSHVENKEIVMNQNMPHPLTSINRISKYISRGFKISQDQSVILGLLISKMNLKNPETMLEWINSAGYIPDDMLESEEMTYI